MLLFSKVDGPKGKRRSQRADPCHNRCVHARIRSRSISTASFSTWMGMSVNHLVGGRAFILFGRTRKGGSGWNRPVDSFLIRDEADRGTDLWNSSRRCYDYWSLRRKRERKRERKKENRMGCRGGNDDGHARPSSRGRRSSVSSSRKVLSRAKILRFDVRESVLSDFATRCRVARSEVVFHRFLCGK